MLGALARKFRRVFSAFQEKPSATLDDYLLEHFMLYHGLVGTSPENQRRFKDVRADVVDALSHKSSTELAIALKLPPLWWEEKLQTIFTEAQMKFPENLRATLLPEGEAFELAAESDPLRHPDWRVRANAARMLAHLQMIEGVPRMVAALDDEAPEQKAAFCHIAYSFAKLRTPQSRLALTKHLYSEEPWFRVDSAGALASWPLPEVANDLMTAIQDPHALTDYSSVAIAKQHQPAELLRLQDDLLQEGALETSIGLLQATAGTFSSEILVESRLHSCLPRIVELAEQHGTPRRWRAVLELCDWICKDLDDIAYQDRTVNKDKTLSAIRDIRERLSSERVGPLLLEWLRENHLNLADGSQLRHASKLCATFDLKEATPYLIPVAAAKSRAVNEAIDALAQLAATEAAPHLVQLAGQIVDIDERTTKLPSKQAVFEDNPAAAKTYWHILKAMACMPTSDTLEYLLKASRDFAADKRQQALASLICVGSTGELKTTYEKQVKERVSEGLSDPSPQVRVAALQGVAELQLFSLLPEVVKLTQSRDTSVWKQATTTVKRLHADGFSGQVEETIGTAAARERDQYRRDKLRSLLDSLKS